MQDKKDRIIELMDENSPNMAELRDLLSQMNTVDIADAFDPLSKEKAVQIFRLLPKDIAADVFSYIVPDKQQIIVEALTDNEVGKIINDLYVDDAVDFLEEMPANVVSRVLQTVKDEKRQLINQILQYPDDSAGSIMTTEYVGLKEIATVKEAFDEIRTTGLNKETIYTCYVTKRDRILIGIVSVKDLLLADQSDKISDIMDTNLIFVHTTDDQEAIANLFRKYGLLSLPVVDKEQRLVGIVTVDDIVQIIEDENTEDFEKMSALSPSEEPYMKTGIFRLAGNRFPWLLFLMLSAAITGGIITKYENSLAVMPVLMAFIPMLMDSGGNAGSQSSTLIIRGMALDEIHARDILKVLWREIRVGTICGFGLGIVNFVRIYLMNGRDVLLSFAVSISLVITLIMAKSAGCVLPLIAKRLKMDPAVMAAPLITTIIDAASLVVYFFIVKFVFNI